MTKAAFLAILAAAAPAAAADLTIYSQDFALVQETIALDLKPGVNHVVHAAVTGQVEPDTIILRDPSGRLPFRIVEQTYNGGAPTLGLLLSLYEGKTLEFLVPGRDGAPEHVVTGTVVRSGYEAMGVSRRPAQTYGQPPSRSPEAIVEVEGKVRFGTPGVALFPAPLSPAMIEPTVDWVIRADKPGHVDAELAYMTGGLTWQADYSVIAPEPGDAVEILGWATLENQSGRSFPDARIALVAGEASKRFLGSSASGSRSTGSLGPPAQPPPFAKETPLDDAHVYALGDPISLPDRATRQVELLRAAKAATRTVYVYDGVKIDVRSQGWSPEMLRSSSDFGTDWTPQVWVMKEIANTAANGLGTPLPKGTLRYYRRDAQGRLWLVGETEVGHSAPGDTLRAPAGSASDLSGERRRVEYQMNTGGGRGIDETFEIAVRNRGRAPAEVRIVEHLYRGRGWKISIESDPHVAKDSSTIEYRVSVPAQGEKTVRYAVRYAP